MLEKNRTISLLGIGFLFVLLTIFGFRVVFATWNGQLFTPGQTLDPGCAPTDANCGVYINSVSSTAMGLSLTTDGLTLASSVPATTTDTLYNIGGVLLWNGSPIGSGSGSSSSSSGILFSTNIPALTYDASSGLLSLAPGYTIPLSASTTYWEAVADQVNGSSSDWNTAYTIINASSGNWDFAYNTINASSAAWSAAVNYVNASSTNWDTAYNILEASSSGWITAPTYAGNAGRVLADNASGTGVVWVNALLADNNFSDLTNISAAQNNLGLGATSSVIFATTSVQALNATGLNISKNGITLASATPSAIANTLYSLGNTLYWNGAAVTASGTQSNGTVNGEIQFTDGNGNFIASTGLVYATSTGLSVNGNVSSTGSIVNGNATTTGNTNLLGNENVVGNVNVSSTLSVSGTTILSTTTVAALTATGLNVSTNGIILASSVPVTTTNALYNLGNTLYWNGASVTANLLSSSLGNGQVLIGNASGTAAAQIISGDATISNTGVLTLATITAANKVLGSAIQLATGGGLQNTSGLSVLLNGTSLQLGTSGIAINLGNANAWTGIQTFNNAVLNGGISGSAIDTDGTLTANSNTLIPTEKAVRTYVGSFVNGLSWRPAVDVLDNSQTNAGANIVGHVSYTADGVALTNGMRILLNAETANTSTYLNKVFTVGGVGTSITLTLATDGQAGTGAPTIADTVFVRSGTTNGNKTFTYSTSGTWVLSGALSGALLATNNLSDVSNAAAARTNLGLGATSTVTFGTNNLSVLTVTNTSTLGNIIGTNESLSGGLSVLGSTTLATTTTGSLTATGLNVNGNATTTGNTNLLGTLNVSSTLNVSGTANLATTTISTLNVTGSSTLATTTVSSLTVNGTSTLNGLTFLNASGTSLNLSGNLTAASGTTTLATTTVSALTATGLTVSANGIILASSTPGTTTNALYNSGNSLYWNGSALASGASNGLTLTSGTVSLGGTLSTSTTINEAGNNLAIINGIVGIGGTSGTSSLTFGTGATTGLVINSGASSTSGLKLTNLAQAPVSTYTASVYVSSGLSLPYGLYLDAAGNLFVVNQASSVGKITPGGVYGTLGTTGSTPTKMVQDASGNSYTANYNGASVTKITPAGVTTTLTAGTNPTDIAIDTAGNLYVSNFGSNNVTKITPAGSSTVFATLAAGSNPTGIVIDPSGNLYVANNGLNTVTKITPAGATSTLGTTGNTPWFITLDSSGNVYTANYNSNNVTKITPAGVSSIYASVGSNPRNLIFDASGNLYVSNWGSANVSKITPAGVVTTIGNVGNNPLGLAIDNAGDVFVADYGSNNIYKLTPTSNNKLLTVDSAGNLVFATNALDVAALTSASNGLTSVNGSLTLGGALTTSTIINQSGTAFSFINGIINIGSTTNNGFGTGATTGLVINSGVANTSGLQLSNLQQAPVSTYTSATFATTGNGPALIYLDASNNLFVVNNSAGTVGKISSTGVYGAFGNAGTFATKLVQDASGNSYITNSGSNNVTKITPGGVASTFASVGTGPYDITIDASGNLYVTDFTSNDVYKITPAGSSTLFAQLAAGTGPRGITIDAAGNLYTANATANTVTKITPAGATSTFATTGSGPNEITIDGAGNLYTSNSSANTVTKITPAGVASTLGATGSGPRGIAVDAAGNVYTANFNSNNVTKITPAGVATTISTVESTPWGIAVDNAGDVYVSNNGANTITKITPATANKLLTVDAAGNIVFATNALDINTSNPAFSALSAATATSTIDNGGYTQTWNWSTTTSTNALVMNANGLTTGNLFSLSSNSTSTASSSALANLTLSGNATSAAGNAMNVNLTGASSSAQGIVINNIGTGLSENIQGAIALKKGNDFTTPGQSNNVNFGNTSLIRLNATSSQTITGIAAGADGQLLTIINAGTAIAGLANLNASSSAGNQIVTGTNSTLSIGAGASVSLVYDAGSSVWRVVGGSGGSTTYASVTLGDFPTGGAIGTAAATVDIASNFNINQSTTLQTLTIPTPTASSTSVGKVITVNDTGSANFTIGGVTVPAGSYGSEFVWNGTIWNPINAASNVAAINGTAVVAATTTTIGGGVINFATSQSLITFTLPSAGTYRVETNLRGYTNGVANNAINGAIADPSGTLVPNSEFLSAYSNTTAGVSQDAGGNVLITVTTPGTYTVKVWNTNNTATSQIYSDSNGRSTVSWTLVSGNTPVTGQSVDSLYVTYDNTTNGPQIGPYGNFTSSTNNAVLDTIQSGNLSYSTSTGNIVLLPNKTYEIEAGLNTVPYTGGYPTLGSVDTGAQAGCYFQFYNVTNAAAPVAIGTQNRSTAPGGSTQQSTIVSTITAVITTGASSMVIVPKQSQCPGSSNSSEIAAASSATSPTSYILVTQLGTSAFTTVSMSALSAALTSNALDNANFAQTWNWSSATSTTALTLNGNSLTSGGLLSLNSSSTSFTGSLESLALTGNATTTTGNVLSLAVTGASSSATGLNIVNLGAGLSENIQGAIALQHGTDFTTNATTTLNNVSFANASLIRIVPSTSTFLGVTGITGGVDGKLLTLVNAATSSFSLYNLNASSSAANQIITGTGSNLTLAAGASVELIYDSQASVWRVVGGTGSSGTSTPFSFLSGATTSTTLDNTNYLQTWNWSTESSTNALVMNANGLTTGNLFSLSSNSTSTASSSALENLTLSGNSTGTAGNAIKVNLTGASSSAQGLLINNIGTGLSENIQGAIALKKGNDYTVTGQSNNVNFGNTSLVRLNATSSQTITGIAAGSDGQLLTIINAGTSIDDISNQNASSTGANQITTGTASDLYLAPNGSISLVYDAGAGVWRVVGGTGTSSNSLASVSTVAVTNATTTSATTGGMITNTGGSAITAAGVAYNTTGSPLVTASHTVDSVASSSFVSVLTGLTAGTTYYIRAYVTNANGTSYGPQITFFTGNQTTQTFTYTGNQQAFTVPAGVTSITINAKGAGGYSGTLNPGGTGGGAQGVMTVTPGQVLYINVGGAGNGATGGFNGGGNGVGSYGGGGGASDVRTGGVALANRVIVAGGGGGGNNEGSNVNINGTGPGTGSGGGAGTLAAGGGGNCGANYCGGGGGIGYGYAGGPGGFSGGTDSSAANGGGGAGGGITGGGQGGIVNGTQYGATGTLGTGGAASSANSCTHGGGGGGGYYGGGGAAGSNCGSGQGGGGSSWTGTLTSPVFTVNATPTATNGSVTITYTTTQATNSAGTIVGSTVDYINASLSGASTVGTVGTAVPFAISNSGNITLSSNTFTLNSGETYNLLAQVGLNASSSSGSSVNFGWYNVSGGFPGTPIPGGTIGTAEIISGNTSQPYGYANAIVTTSSSIQVAVEITSVAGATPILDPTYSGVNIVEMGTTNAFAGTLALSMNNLVGATANGALDNLSYGQIWNWSTATTTTALTLTGNSLTSGGLLSLTSNSGLLNSSSGLLYVANNGTSTLGLLASFATPNASSTGLYILNNGNIGINTTSTSNALTINGGISLSSTTPATTTNALYNSGNSLFWNGSALALNSQIAPNIAFGGVTGGAYPATGTPSTFATVGTNPESLAFDNAGNLYTANYGSNSITKITPSGATSTFATVGTNPHGLIFDAAGNLYVAIRGSNYIQKITPSGATSTFATVGTSPVYMAFDAAGNMYVTNNGSNNVTKITPSGATSTFATVGSTPWGLIFDNAGNLYTANYGSNTVSKITPSGAVTTISVGTNPYALALDNAGNVYVSNSGSNNIVKITPSGATSTFATVGSAPQGLVFDNVGNLYATNYNSGNVSRITPSGVVTTFASVGTNPLGMAFDAAGNLYVANSGSANVTKIAGIANTFANTSISGKTILNGALSVVGNAAFQSGITIGGSSSTQNALIVNTNGNVAVGFGTSTAATTNVLNVNGGISLLNTAPATTTFALYNNNGALTWNGATVVTGSGLPGNISYGSLTGGSSAATGTVAQFATVGTAPQSIVFDAAGNAYTANETSNNITKITPTGATSTFATTGSSPVGMVMDQNGNIYVANFGSNTVSKISPAGVSVTFATVDTGPRQLAFDASGNLYVINYTANDISKITPTGVVTTNWASLGAATLPYAMAFDANGNLYTANQGNSTISKITPTGATSTFATVVGNPQALVFDASGNLYVGITNGTISKVTPAGAVTNSWATGLGGGIDGLAMDAAGNIYSANYSASTVSKITPAGVVTATWASVGYLPSSIAFDTFGNLYTTANGSSTVSKITGVANATANTLLNGNTSVNGALSITGFSAFQNGISIGTNASGTANAVNLNLGGASSTTQGILITNLGTGLSENIQGAIALNKGSDFTVTGQSNNVSFGNTSLVRLNATSSQTITGIAAGADGQLLTIINAGTAIAGLANLNASSSAANQIVTGTNTTLSIAAGASVSLVYDAGSSVWRVVGGASGAVTYSSVNLGDFPTGGAIGTAAATVDIATNFNIGQATAGQTLSLPTPTASSTSVGKVVTVSDTGSAMFVMYTTQISPSSPAASFVWTGTTWNPVGGTSNVASSFGEDDNITDLQTTSTSAFVDVSGSTFTLPSAGTWEVTYNIYSVNDAPVLDTAQNAIRIVDALTGTNVVPSSTASLKEAVASSTFLTSNVVRITTTGATSYKLQWNNQGGTGTIFNDATNGNSKIVWQEISGNASEIGQTVDYYYAGFAGGNSSGQYASTSASTAQGNLTNSSNGIITLNPYKTYSLSAQIIVPATNVYEQWEWWNYTSNTALSGASVAETTGGNGSGVVTTNTNIDDVAQALITTTSTMQVGVKIVAANATNSTGGYMQIVQIGTTAITGISMNSLSGALASGALDNTNFSQTWNWSTATSTTGLTLNGNSLTSGGLLSLNSSSTALTGSLETIGLTGNSASTTGNALLLSISSASSSATALNIANLGAGLSENIQGAIALQAGTDYVPGAGMQNNVVLANASFIRVNATTTTFLGISGIAGGVNGKLLTLANAATSSFILFNQNASSSAANQIITGTGGNLTLAANASVQLIYDPTATAWRVVGGSGGSAAASVTLGNFATGGVVGSSSVTVDVVSNLNIAQTTAGQILSLPNPTNTTGGKVITVSNTGSAAFTMYSTQVSPTSPAASFLWNGTTWQSIGGTSNVASVSGSQTFSGASTGVTTGVPATTNPNFTIPSAGTWQITLNANAISGSTGGTYALIQFVNASGTVMASTTYALANSDGSTSLSGSGSITDIVSTTGPTTYTVQYGTPGSGSSSMNGSVSWIEISGNASEIGQTVDYSQVYRTTAQTGLTANGQAILFDASTGNIPYSSSTGSFTLTAGKTYQLTAGVVAYSQSPTPARPSFGWYDVTDSVNLGAQAGLMASADTASNAEGGGIARAVITPTTNITVQFRIVSGANTGGQISAGDFAGGNNYAAFGTVQQFGTTAITGVAMNTLSAAIANGSLDNTNFSQTWNWSTATSTVDLALTSNALTTGSILSLTSNSNTLNSTSGLLYVGNNGTSTLGLLASFVTPNASSTGFYIFNNGKVAIGSTTATSILTLTGNNSTTPFTIATSSGAAVLTVNQSGQIMVGTSTNDGIAGVTVAPVLGSNQAGELAIISSNGDNGFADFRLMSSAATTTASTWQISRRDSATASNSLEFANYPSGAFTPRVTFMTNGSVGIGTTTPATTLSIVGNASNTNAQISLTEITGGAQGWISRFSNRLQINATDNVDIGIGSSTATGYSFTSTGLQPDVNSTQNLGGASNRWNTVYSVNILNTSDARLKTNIESSTFGLTQVMELNPVTFNWIDPTWGTSTNIGFLAQQVLPILPDAVSGDASTTYSLNYNAFIPVIVSAIQTQQGLISSTTAELDAVASTTAQNTADIATLKTEIAAGAGSGAGASITLDTLNQLSISGGLEVDGHVALGADTVGEATIASNATSAAITFASPYVERPSITITPEAEISGMSWIDNISPNGFSIELSQPQSSSVTFSWHAFAEAGNAFTLETSTSTASSTTSNASSTDGGDSSTTTPSSNATTTTLNVTLNVVGGSAVPGDFTVALFAGHPSQSSFVGNASGIPITLDANVAYSMNVNGPANYTEGTNGNCNQTSGIPVGLSTECVITETFNGSISATSTSDTAASSTASSSSADAGTPSTSNPASDPGSSTSTSTGG